MIACLYKGYIYIGTTGITAQFYSRLYQSFRSHGLQSLAYVSWATYPSRIRNRLGSSSASHFDESQYWRIVWQEPSSLLIQKDIWRSKKWAPGGRAYIRNHVPAEANHLYAWFCRKFYSDESVEITCRLWKSSSASARKSSICYYARFPCKSYIVSHEIIHIESCSFSFQKKHFLTNFVNRRVTFTLPFSMQLQTSLLSYGRYLVFYHPHNYL